jgi:hypothetical protein
MQGSFKPLHTSNQVTNGDGSSLMMSNIEGHQILGEGGDYLNENVLDFAKEGGSPGNYKRH